MIVAKLIGETVVTLRHRGTLHVELFRATALAALASSAAAHGGLADLAQVRARVPLSRRSDARRSDSHAAAVTRSHACSQAQLADTETDSFIHPQAATPPLDESGADK